MDFLCLTPEMAMDNCQVGAINSHWHRLAIRLTNETSIACQIMCTCRIVPYLHDGTAERYLDLYCIVLIGLVCNFVGYSY